MRKNNISIFLMLFLSLGTHAQNIVKGIVLDNDSENPLPGVLVSVVNTNLKQETDFNGAFTIKNISNGSYVVKIKLEGYETQNFPLEFIGKTINLGAILFYKDVAEDQDLSLITLTDDELNDDASAADNIAGLLQATRDIYLRTAAFEFSSSFLE
jgi:hypothetical protein